MKKRILVLLGVFVFCLAFGAKDASAAPPAKDVACDAPCINSFEIEDGAVTTTDILDGTIGSADIGDNSVGTADIADETVGSADIADGAVTSADIADGAVTSADIADGTVTSTDILDGTVGSADIADNSVGTADIADGTVGTADVAGGAITDVKVTGPISASKIQQGSGSGLDADLLDGLNSSVFSQKYDNVLVVAKSGGDYTTIQGAIDAISPSSSDRYLVKVMPGTYVEKVAMKSYMHLQGAGRDVTTIEAPLTTDIVINLSALTNVQISGLTIKGGNYGIYTSTSSLKVTRSTFTANSYGIFDNSSPSSSVIISNEIKGNSNHGITSWASSSTITENTVTGNSSYGIYTYGSFSPKIIHNVVTNNGTDLYVSSGSTPNISFNMYDTISGTTGVGLYNVKSDGTPW